MPVSLMMICIVNDGWMLCTRVLRIHNELHFLYVPYLFNYCDDSLPVCCMCLDLVMISDLVFVGADG